MSQMQPADSSITSNKSAFRGDTAKTENQPLNSGGTEADNFDYLNNLDGYNLKNDPRYLALCRNRSKCITYQSFPKNPFPSKEEKIRKQLSELLEYDFERRLPLRTTHSFENLARGFSSSL